MSTTKDRFLTYLLTPLSWIYGSVMSVRNWMFESRILKSVEYDIPVVGVGNITVGGTGKTPHVEYIANGLSTEFKVAVLSRGYKRKTKGFVLANSNSTPTSIGDEPYQIYQKLGSRVIVAVCESRKKGIEELVKLFPDLEVIVLDDAFQHRWVKPKISILLSDYNRPIYKDKILPLGRLRESAREINRADMVIVTKCPEDLMPINYRITFKDLDLMSFQQLFFSRYKYEELKPIFPDEAPYSIGIEDLGEEDGVLLLTGIAHPRYFVRHFKKYPFKVKVLHYPDHHDYTRNDVMEIEKRFSSMPGIRKIIVTTEKDAVRLMHSPYFPKALKPYTFYLPIEIEMIQAMEEKDLIQEIKQQIKKPIT